MSKTIIQEVVFNNTTAQTLYDLYMDAAKHSLISGSPVTISEVIGSTFSSHGGYITGKTLQVERGKLIVQAWRAQSWDTNDVDSTFIALLQQKGNDAVLTMTHANIPDQHVESVDKGWHEHYWKPLKQYLAGETITRPQM